jgi:hypothetical protein
MINYRHYENKIVKPLGVALDGWPLPGNVRNPGDLTRDDLAISGMPWIMASASGQSLPLSRYQIGRPMTRNMKRMARWLMGNLQGSGPGRTVQSVVVKIEVTMTWKWTMQRCRGLPESSAAWIYLSDWEDGTGIQGCAKLKLNSLLFEQSIIFVIMFDERKFYYIMYAHDETHYLRRWLRE